MNYENTIKKNINNIKSYKYLGNYIIILYTYSIDIRLTVEVVFEEHNIWFSISVTFLFNLFFAGK